MLTFEENEWNFTAFKILSTLNLLPIQIDLKTGKVERQRSKIRKFLCGISLSVGVFHWFYMFGRLLQSTVLEPQKYFRWDHFIIHFPFVVIYFAFHFMGFCMFVKNPRESEMIFNQLFVEGKNPVQKISEEELEKSGENIDAEETDETAGQAQVQVFDPDQNSIRPLFTWPPKYSLDELLTRFFSIVVFIAAFFALIILTVDPSRPQLLYSALPSKYQNVGSFLSLLTVEANSLALGTVSVVFSIVTQLLFFGKCRKEFQRLNLQLKNLEENFKSCSIRDGGLGREKRIVILRQISKEMRELVLFIELFNRCFPFSIFAFKIVCLFSILFYFFAIRHFHDFALLATFSAFVAIAATLVYGILYHRAFSIPEEMERLKREFLLIAQETTKKSNQEENVNFSLNNLNSNKIYWAEMEREIQRIQNIGIKVGCFHTLERETTPKFVDFVFQNVVNLLVTFPP